ncbi:MAG: HEAT repeat domain-containing protein [Candidatus Thiothrix moscowensis]|nr:HEAT repeat domain-containing protein [Candidatus Thiothrix moscowensis]
MTTTPYPGLRPYQEHEQASFYGRAADTAALTSKIPASRLTLLFAATGVGKSSLLQAAVLPILKAEDGFHLDVVYYNDWVAPPLAGLQQAVRKALLERHDSLPVTPADMALADFFHTLAPLASQPLVVVLDQFEEFFRYRFVHHRDSFQPFIDQLADVILADDVPVALVFSMREDFALELNAFKPHLPNPLFGNYYRLEKLSETGARAAITTPLSMAGYHYEPELLEQLLHDLLSRDLSRDAASLVQGVSADSVEPPYLQIVCSQLWELDKDDPSKTLRLATYRKAGGAKGLLENYVNHVLKRFADREKQVASKAFDHLISRRGTKMAYTPDDLATLVGLKPAELGKVLDKLEQARILRRQQRDQTVWYELYHDMFSGGIESWNTHWKNHMRLRRTVMATGASLLALAGIWFSVVAYLQASSKHLRLGNGNNDRVEVYTGTSKFPDPFGQQRYAYETGLSRNQLELDKRYPKRDVQDYSLLVRELIGSQPADSRFSAYIEAGEYCQVSTLLGQVMPDAKPAPGCKDKRETLIRQGQASPPVAKAAPLSPGVPPAPDTAEQEHDPLRDAIFGSLGSLKTPWGLALLQQVAATPGTQMYPGQWSVMLNPLTMPVAFDAAAWLEQLQQNGTTQSESNFSDPRVVQALVEWFMQDASASTRIADGSQTVSGLMRDLLMQQPAEDTGMLRAVLQRMDIAPALRGLLEHKDANRREVAFLLLAFLQDASVIDSLPSVLNTNNVAYLIPRAIGVDDARLANLLHDMLADRKRLQEERSYIAEALGTIGRAESAPVLLARLQDPAEWERVRSAAANALGQMGDASAADALLALVSNPQERLEPRIGAMEALVAMAYEGAVPVLLARFKDAQERQEIRTVAASALALLGDASVVPALLEAFQNPALDIESARPILFALGILGDKRALPVLLAYRERLPPIARVDIDAVLPLFDDPQVQQLLPATLAPASARSFKAKLDAAFYQSPLALYTAMGTSARRTLRWHDIQTFYYGSLQYGLNPDYLPVIGGQAHRQLLLEASNTPDVNRRVQVLLQLLGDDSAHFSLRQRALGLFDADMEGISSELRAAAIQQVQALGEHPNILLRRAAVQALTQLHSGKALLPYTSDKHLLPENQEAVLKRFADTAPRAEAIAELLKRAGDEGNPALQASAWALLGEMQATEALPLLESSLQILEQEYREWRSIRDQRPPDDADQATFGNWQQAVKQASPKHAYLAAHYGYALARMETARGIQALAHDLADVRDGAGLGFAASASVASLQQLDAERVKRQATEPVFGQAAFRAIDRALQRLENTTDQAARQSLLDWQTSLQSRADDDAVKQRLAWTLNLISHYQTQAEEFKAKYGLERML